MRNVYVVLEIQDADADAVDVAANDLGLGDADNE